jgi:peptidoglycan/LPS O-acetylase OafA/YrhL
MGGLGTKKGIRSLAGIRGAAAVWVLTYHLQDDAGTYFGLPQLEDCLS